MKTTFIQWLVLTAGLAAVGLLLAGCGGYYYEGYYADGGGVAVAGPVYGYEYYYDPAWGCYYYYSPRFGWRYYPGVPGPGAVFWAGPAPVYLPPPAVGFVAVAPPASLQFYFDADLGVYYCYDPRFGWRYYRGVPPPHCVFWHGPPPSFLPHPPHRFVRVRPPASFRFYFDPHRRVYYYHDPHAGWHYYPGAPPEHVQRWHGPVPRALPRPPLGGPGLGRPGHWKRRPGRHPDYGHP